GAAKTMLDPLEQPAQTGELPVQPDGGPADAAQGLPFVAHLRPQDRFLGTVKVSVEFDRIPLDHVDDMLDDRLQEMRHAFDLAAVPQRLASRLDRREMAMPPADQEVMGQREAELADLVRGAIQAPDQIADDAIDAAFMAMQLLMLVRGEEHPHR